MIGCFSRAAIDCIAKCAMMPMGASTMSGAAIVKNYTNKKKPFSGLEGKLFTVERKSVFYIYEFEVAFQFYSFSNLLELGVRTGYVDLSTWDQREELNEAVGEFVAQEAESRTPCDLTLIEALSTRLIEKKYRVDNLDIIQFNAFASLLNLETRIRNDSNARKFIENTQQLESWKDDLAFLVTAEHFAAALVSELQNEEVTGTISGGLAAMQYFSWFADILRTLKKVGGLDEAFVREAMWAQQAHNVQNRISFWSERMTEWASGGLDHDGEFAWKQISDAFFVIKEKVNEIWPEKIEELNLTVKNNIDDLISEGRLSGALRLAREDAEQCAYKFGVKLKENLDKNELVPYVNRLLMACKDLAKLGDMHNAAAFIAPFTYDIRCIDYEGGKEAVEMLAQARAEKFIASRVHVDESQLSSEMNTNIESIIGAYQHIQTSKVSDE